MIANVAARNKSYIDSIDWRSFLIVGLMSFGSPLANLLAEHGFNEDPCPHTSSIFFSVVECHVDF